MLNLLEVDEQKRKNKLREYIIKHKLKENYKKCGYCNGTGLEGVGINDGGFSWEGGFCYHCNGIGYNELKKLEGMVTCSKCEGIGCLQCNNLGLLDWISALRYGVE